MPDDHSPAPPHRDDTRRDPDGSELRETLDLLGTLVASLSDRVDDQTATLDRLTKTAAETRAAAFHAKSQMDMRPVGEAISHAIETTLTPVGNALIGLGQDIQADRRKTKSNNENLFHRIDGTFEQRRRQIEGLQTRNWISIAAIGALVLVLTTAALTPWAVASLSGELACNMMAGIWIPNGKGCAL